MLTLRFAFLSAFVFGVAHYVASALASAIGVFLLNWWEPKWGSPWGSWMMDVTAFLPLFAGASTIGAVLTILAAWRYLRGLSTRRLLTVSMIAGCVTALIGYVLIYLSQHLPRSAGDTILAAAQVWLVIGSVIVWLVVALRVSRRSDVRQAA